MSVWRIFSNEEGRNLIGSSLCQIRKEHFVFLEGVWELAFIDVFNKCVVKPKSCLWFDERLPFVLRYFDDILNVSHHNASSRLLSSDSQDLSSRALISKKRDKFKLRLLSPYKGSPLHIKQSKEKARPLEAFDKTGTAYVTLFDGWREGFEPLLGRMSPRYIPLTVVELESHGYITRMRHRFFPVDEDTKRTIWLSRIQPLLNDNLIAFNRHKGDYSVTLIPDPDFIETRGYLSTRILIDQYDISWEKKIARFVWRGNKNGSPYAQYQSPNTAACTQLNPLSQRELLCCMIETVKNQSTQEKFDVGFYFDKSKAQAGGKYAKKYKTSMNITEMLRYKYQIDIDGEVNAWSGLYWKLYSQSVVIKIESHFEQWYYKNLKPWIHYVPINANFSDFYEIVDWVLTHDTECKQIALNGKLFASKLTYESVIAGSHLS